MGTKKAPIIMTVIFAVLAGALGIFALYHTGVFSGNESSSNTVHLTADEELELRNATQDLISKNIIAYSLFYTDELPLVPEPYGNVPEDGYYAVNMTYNDLNKKLYTVLNHAPDQKEGNAEYQQIETFVNKIYTPDLAKEILNNSDNTNKPVFKDKDGRLGVKADHQSISSKRNWQENISILYDIKTTSECEITILFNNVTEQQYDSGEFNQDDVVKATIYKINGEWRLNEIVE